MSDFSSDSIGDSIGDSMNAMQGLAIAEQLIFTTTSKRLDDLSREIFKRSWMRQQYHIMAEELGYEFSYVRDRGAVLFKLLSQALQVQVSKSNFKGYILQIPSLPIESLDVPKEEPIEDSEPGEDRNFVGRKAALAELDALVEQGAKIILIQGQGGIGKTTLARKYLERRDFSSLLELFMATEAATITPVESVVEEWLRRTFSENTTQDFGINLERLRQHLRQSDRPVGILIDNLESALNDGTFIESRRSYIELLRVLADPKVHAVTLMTSRERLTEALVSVHLYCLASLDQDAWQRYFKRRGILAQCEVVCEMWQAYGGNAKAMRIISGAILTDFDGDCEAYWQHNQSNLLAEPELQNLVMSQFQKLEQSDREAYQLLCRLGCYRYQDVSSVSLSGLCCLMWDVPEENHQRVIRSLQNRSLIEARRNQKFWLHPVIRAKALKKLKASSEWYLTHEYAAGFWIKSVQFVGTVDDALRALEAYYHYLEIENYEKACEVLVQLKDSQWGEEMPLGWLFYRLGLLQQMVSAITRVLTNVQPAPRSGILYNLVGYIQRLSGNVQQAFKAHEQASAIAETFNHAQLKASTLLNLGLCRKDLGDLEAAIADFQTVCELTQTSTDVRSDSIIYAHCCLAYLHSCLEQRESALAYVDQVNVATLSSCATVWGSSYSFLYLAATHRNLGNVEQAFQYYRQTMHNAEESHFTQIIANVLHGMAQLFRVQGEFETAIDHHTRAIDLLATIGAKCDLAEAHFQLGLTYQTMDAIAQSYTQFDRAIELYQEIGAPLRIRQVQRSRPS